MVLLAYRRGLRASEVTDLRREQVDQSASLHIRLGFAVDEIGVQTPNCTAAILSRPSPLWVRSGHFGMCGQCPLFSQKRTS
jgi:hypothetical protein